MKRDLKFLKSLALTGMLTTTILGTVAYADTENKDVKTEPIGIFNELVTDTKNVVPFVLTNREDYISKKDIEESNEFKNKTVVFDREVQENTRLHTGDTFKVNGTTHTILIYGDVNQDGEVDVFDAVTIQENVFESSLKEIQKIAANVVIADESEMDVFDAVAIQKYVGGAIDTILDKIPTKEEEQKPTPPPPPPPVETSKISGFVPVDLTASLDAYHRYDEKIIIGTVKSSDDVKLQAKYIKYKVKKDNVDVSNILTYKENETEKGTFNIEFYATEKGTYTITPCVQGKDGLIEKTENNITISVEENLEVTDIEIVGISNKITVSEGKTKEFAIKLYHKYTATVKSDITDQVIVTNISREKTGTNATVNFRQNDANKTLINVNNDGKFIGGSNVHLGYIEVNGSTEGKGDTITIKVGNKEVTLDIEVTGKAAIVGITTNGKTKTERIDINLYKSIPSTEEECEDVDVNGVGAMYKIGNEYIHKYNEKAYTIIPLQLIDKENDIVKITIDNFTSSIILNTSTEDQNGKVSITVDSQNKQVKASDISYTKYTIKENPTTHKLIYAIATGSEPIDAIGIALNRPTMEASINRVENGKNGGVTIDCGETTETTTRISTPIYITIKPENP